MRSRSRRPWFHSCVMLSVCGSGRRDGKRTDTLLILIESCLCMFEPCKTGNIERTGRRRI